MEKTYKRIPFDIELAKKIQSGDVKGRIMYNGRYGNKEIIILSYNYDKQSEQYPIRFVYAYVDEIDYLHDTSSLFIELPEETPKQYPYDRVKDKITDADRQEAEKTFPDSYNMQSAFISGVAYQICKEIDCQEAPKHEFKPFDKVLIRDHDDEKWTIGLFSHIEDIDQCYPYVCAGNLYMRQCIQFEGHEHLVGTTNNPE